MPVWWAGCCWQRWQRAMWGPCDDGWGWELDGLECDVRRFKSIGAMKAYTPTQQDGSVTTQLVPNVKRQLTEWWMSDQIIVTAGIHINKKETGKKTKHILCHSFNIPRVLLWLVLQLGEQSSTTLQLTLPVTMQYISYHSNLHWIVYAIRTQ